MPSDSDYINFSEDHELNYCLERNGLRETEANREELRSLEKPAKTIFGKESSQWLTHDEIDAIVIVATRDFEKK